MDFTPIIAKHWGALGWFTPLMLQNGALKSPWAKGEADELPVLLFAHWQLDTQTYRHLHNVTLSTQDGITQIDHVFLSHYGTEGIGFACYIKSFQPMVFHVAEVDALMHALQAGWRTLPLATHRVKRPSNPTAGRKRPKLGCVLETRNMKTGLKVVQQFWGLFRVSLVQSDAQLLTNFRVWSDRHVQLGLKTNGRGRTIAKIS